MSTSLDLISPAESSKPAHPEDGPTPDCHFDSWNSEEPTLIFQKLTLVCLKEPETSSNLDACQLFCIDFVT